jgi:hypothetical protein
MGGESDDASNEAEPSCAGDDGQSDGETSTFFRDLSGFLRLNSDDLKACANELS